MITTQANVSAIDFIYVKSRGSWQLITRDDSEEEFFRAVQAAVPDDDRSIRTYDMSHEVCRTVVDSAKKYMMEHPRMNIFNEATDIQIRWLF